MIKLNKKATGGTWVPYKKYKGIKFLIKPVSLFSMNTIPSDEKKFNVEGFWDMFNASLINWEGVVDDDNKVLVCDEANKKLLFDFDQEIAGFVSTECMKLREKVVVTENEAKN